MSEVVERCGKCLCGAVRVTAKNAGNGFGACHCNMCRRWGGGPLMAINCGADVSIEGAENVSVYDSSAWAERGFCRQCGSHLFYRIKETGQHIIPVGIFGSDENFVFDSQVFIDEKPSFYSFSNKTHDMTGAELFAKYGSSDTNPS